MQPVKKIKIFQERYPFLGPIMWILCAHYYLVQIIAARAWTMPYSLAHNTISDLGNTVCSTYADRYVCSPLHGLMNSSFILLGLFMMIGSLLIFHEFKKSIGSRIGFSLMTVAGFGTLLVGLFPENTDRTLHFVGALLPFLFGNIALVVFSYSLYLSKTLRLYTRFSGLISLIALIFFVQQHYLGLGIGGIERIVAYPQTMWLIVFGVYISKNHLLGE